ncbi:Protein Tyrosine Phosphatase [Cichlidogyrus casuarinus]|uniref:Protein Tyrosine Phosphatase n=1 Tax=Cichlidogyrus casuarinus TaxID=1844966 RepID=A0ABD2QNW9_9PLAT
MIWEQNSNIIVMTSQFVERARRKCDQYWPDEGSHLYGNVLVRITSQHQLAYYTVRTFCIRMLRRKKPISCKERVIFHYQYTDWADFDVPRTPLPVLAFVRASVIHWRDSDGPIVVHCSAGVGRTGTYICIESLIRQMNQEHVVNVRGFLEHIRQQRMKLVQTDAQYAFIHDALSEHLMYPLHTIAYFQFPFYVSALRNSKSPSTGQTYLECQFRTITCGFSGRRWDPEFDYSSARDPDNMAKNRSQLHIPLDLNRVNLSYDMSQGRTSNYINASLMPGYRRLDEFIVTQHPLESTVRDFWRMVWEKNSPLIICFPSPDQAELDDFWPVDNSSVREIGWLRIGFIRKGQLCDSVINYEFLLSSTREDYALPCHLWQVTKWPELDADYSEETAPRSALDLLLICSHLVQPKDSSIPSQSNVAPPAPVNTSPNSPSNCVDQNGSVPTGLEQSSLTAAAQFVSGNANSHGPTILVDESV